MLLKYFYDKALAHASYLVGCQRAKQAMIVDPGRDVEQYIAMAAQEGVELTAVAETHIHADYVSGARELAARLGVKLYVSDAGPDEWKYQYLGDCEHQLLKDGDSFMLGNIKLEVIHTPGHTPESISFLLTDQGGNADKPMGIFTGDFVFVGSIGRPDLLEQAAGLANTAEPGARDLFRSIQRFRALPDYLQVWPAHGAGSACGKGLGAVPSSTVGYEKLFNPALQISDEDEFVKYILADQPEAPKYFAEMKRINKQGPAVLGDEELPALQSPRDLKKILAEATVIDLSPSTEFAKSHVPGTVNIPAAMLAGWAGWLIDYAQPVYLIAQPGSLREAMRVLRKIGLSDVRGYFDRFEVREASLATESYHSQQPVELKPLVEAGEVTLIDVRSVAEWSRGHIPGATHHFLGHLPDTISSVSPAKPLVVQCQSGARSAIAASVAQAAGFDVINMAGGYQAWEHAALPVRQETAGTACGLTTSTCSPS